MRPYQRIKAKYCLYIKKDYVVFFKQLKRQFGSYENVIHYLIQKYGFRLRLFSKTVYKSASIYQPKNEEYVYFSFRMKKESAWGELNQMKEITGMSMSLIIRIMLEWEFLANGIQVVKNTVQTVGGVYPAEMNQVWFWIWEGIMLRWMAMWGIVIDKIELNIHVSFYLNSIYIQSKYWYR